MKKLWFKRKRYGYGWSPASIEGWLVIFGYIIVLLLLVFSLGEDASDNDALFFLLIPLGVLTAILIKLSYEHGEKPRWQWGRSKE